MLSWRGERKWRKLLERLRYGRPDLGYGRACPGSAGGKQRRKEEGGKAGGQIALGLLLGVTLNGCGLWENHALGLALGPLWGMALASLYGNGKASKGNPDSEKET